MKKDKCIFFRIDEEIYLKFCERCNEMGIIKKKVLCLLINQWLNENKKKEKQL